MSKNKFFRKCFRAMSLDLEEGEGEQPVRGGLWFSFFLHRKPKIYLNIEDDRNTALTLNFTSYSHTNFALEVVAL